MHIVTTGAQLATLLDTDPPAALRAILEPYLVVMNDGPLATIYIVQPGDTEAELARERKYPWTCNGFAPVT